MINHLQKFVFCQNRQIKTYPVYIRYTYMVQNIFVNWPILWVVACSRGAHATLTRSTRMMKGQWSAQPCECEALGRMRKHAHQSGLLWCPEYAANEATRPEGDAGKLMVSVLEQVPLINICVCRQGRARGEGRGARGGRHHLILRAGRSPHYDTFDVWGIVSSFNFLACYCHLVKHIIMSNVANNHQN